MVRMHRSQRTGAATWATMRSSHSLAGGDRGSVGVGQQRDGRIGDVATSAAASRSGGHGRGHVPGVEGPRDLQRAQPRPGGRVGREGVQLGQGPGGHDLAEPR